MKRPHQQNVWHEKREKNRQTHRHSGYCCCCCCRRCGRSHCRCRRRHRFSLYILIKKIRCKRLNNKYVQRLKVQVVQRIEKKRLSHTHARAHWLERNRKVHRTSARERALEKNCNPYLFVCLDHGPDSRLWHAIWLKDEFVAYTCTCTSIRYSLFLYTQCKHLILPSKREICTTAAVCVCTSCTNAKHTRAIESI